MTICLFDRLREDGFRHGLLRVLEVRFGPLPEEIRKQMTSAPAERFDDLLDKVISAASLQEFIQTM